MLEEKEAAQRGKKPNQKLKTYLVLQYLLRESDREHPKNADDIAQFSDGYPAFMMTCDFSFSASNIIKKQPTNGLL